MRKKDNKPERIFDAAKTAVKIDMEKKKAALERINEAAYSRRIPVLYSRKQILKNQFLYMDKTVPGFQILIYAAMALSVMCLFHKGFGRAEIIIVSMFLSGIMGMISVMVICRVFFSDMVELGESCYFNIYQTTALHMAYSGIINLFVLPAEILFVGSKWKIDLLQTGLYVLVPFVFVQCCCLKVLLTRAGRRNPYIACIVGIFAALFCGILTTTPHLYQASATGFWGGSLILGVLLLGAQIRKLFNEIEKGEILCIN